PGRRDGLRREAGMKALRWTGLVLGLLLAGSAAAQVPPPTHDELALFQEDPSYRTYPQQPVAGWETALRRALRGNDDLGAAAARLAPQYGLAPAQMRRLIELWLAVSQRRYRVLRTDTAARAELRRELLALLRSEE